MTDYTVAQAKALVYAHFLDKWTTAGHSAAVIHWPNYPNFAKPDPPALWCRFRMIHNANASGQVSLGVVGSNDVRFWRQGIVIVQLFVPEDSREATIDAVTEDVLAAFDGVTISGIWFRNVSSNEVGSTPPWFQVNVSGWFRYDQMR